MKKSLVPYLLILVLVGIPACISAPAPTETPLPVSTLPVVATPTSQPDVSSLTVCLGQEPNSLYPFGELNSAARSVLAAIYDGPIDTIEYEYQPVILTQIPSLENGDAEIVRAEVRVGDSVVDADGNISLLEAGVRVRPAECRNEDCVIEYDGTATLELDQMIVTFRLRPDLTWSDGTPLTADDSVYSFDLQKTAAANSFLIDRTQTYEAADAQTLQWFGIPGFIDPTYFTNIWQPAPKHLWSEFPADQLSSIDVSSRTPIGWGPYLIREWNPGDQITLEKNPYYFRAQDGYPKVDQLHFRFIPDPDMALTDLIAGRCDLIDPSVNLEDHVGLLQDMQSAEQAQMYATTSMTMEWLGLGIVPASHDNGYDERKDRQDFFADTYTRQAIAYCIDRKTIVDNVLYGLTSVPTSYIPADHPAFDSDIVQINFDPEIGISLLEQAGWQDTDEDPSTPRRAVNVKRVTFNTPLVLNYYTTSTSQRRQVAAILEESLAQCGIGLDVKYLTASDLYAPGPEGLLLGRQFDLAQYSLGINSVEPACSWFMRAEIPSEANTWTGTNVTGFSNEDYDIACQTAQSSLREEQEYLNSYRQTQILVSDLFPAIPLYSRLRIAVVRPDVCGFELDPTANPLWNIEGIGIGETCQN